MGNIKPSINPKGYRTALKDYSEQSVIEELAANSYDAYASNVLLLLDEADNTLYVLDDGSGFNESSINELWTLGGGNKSFAPEGERVFLGSYGYGLKAVIKYADNMKLMTCSESDKYMYISDINLGLFDAMMDKNSEGYKYETENLPKDQSKGTVIILKLKNPTTKIELEVYGKYLSNLPNHNGDFNCYYGFYRAVKSDVSSFMKDFIGLNEIVKELHQTGKINLATNLFDSELSDCEIENYTDKEDKSVHAKIYFAGMQNGKPKPLKASLRGVYVRVNDRLLKNDFSSDKYTGGISKYIQFKASTRTEISINWLRNEITLSRDTVNFSNPKLETEFKKVVGRLISRFIKPNLEKMSKAKSKGENVRLTQRLELAKKRVSKNTETIIKGIKAGFIYKPDTDAELAILIAQDYIMNKINPAYKLIDYNDKEPFDCMLYDEIRREFIYAELEPTLMEFLAHRNKNMVKIIITWSLGKWRIGSGKTGKGGYFKLLHPDNSLKGNYRLVESVSETSIKPKKHFEVIVVEEILK